MLETINFIVHDVIGIPDDVAVGGGGGREFALKMQSRNLKRGAAKLL